MPTPLDWARAASVAFRAGARDEETLTTALAIGAAESNLNPNAHNNSGEDSRGIWQINLDAHAARWGNRDLFDAATNAEAMWEISSQGTNWGPWSVWWAGGARQTGPGQGRYLDFIDTARTYARQAIGLAPGLEEEGLVLDPVPFPTPGPNQSTDGLLPLAGSPGEFLFGAAALAYNWMQWEASRDGVDLRVISGHRSYEEQAVLYQPPPVGVGPYHAQLNPSGAAAPGTSNHERGLSVDISITDDVLTWLRANAGDHYFVNDVATENWHWTYQGSDMGVVVDGELQNIPPPLFGTIPEDALSDIGGSVTGLGSGVISGIGGLVQTVTDPIAAVGRALADIARFFVDLGRSIAGSLGNPAWWQRVGWLFLGGAMAGYGAVTLGRSLDFPTPGA